MKDSPERKTAGDAIVANICNRLNGVVFDREQADRLIAFINSRVRVSE